MFAQSSDQHCNAAQVMMSFIFAATNMPEFVHQISAHAGWSLSSSSTLNMTKSIADEQTQYWKTLGSSKLTAMVFHNCVTTGLFYQLAHVVPADIKYAKFLWDWSPCNRNCPPGVIPFPLLTYHNILLTRETSTNVQYALMWYIHCILTMEHFLGFKNKLGHPKLSTTIPTMKTIYVLWRWLLYYVYTTNAIITTLYASLTLKSSPWLHQGEVHSDCRSNSLPKQLHCHQDLSGNNPHNGGTYFRTCADCQGNARWGGWGKLTSECIPEGQKWVPFEHFWWHLQCSDGQVWFSLVQEAFQANHELNSWFGPVQVQLM